MPARSSPKSARCLTSTRSAQRSSMSRTVTPKARSCSNLLPEIARTEARQIASSNYSRLLRFRTHHCPYRKSDSAVAVMKSAEDGRRYYAAHVLHGAMNRSVFVERSVSSQLVVIGGILGQKPA